MNDSATAKPQVPLLYRWDYLVLSIGPSDQLKPHSHGAAELRISMADPITFSDQRGCEIDATSILIPPGVRHQNQCGDPISCVLYLDVAGKDFDRLSNQMTKDGPIYTGLPNLRRARNALRQILLTAPDDASCLETVRQEILDGVDTIRPMDHRIAQLVNHLKKHPAEHSPVGVLAASVALSEDRLHHLFSAEVGIPIHRFRLWLRLKHATQLFLDGDTLTTAAHDSGFADSAHLSRTFTKMFGAPPSRLLSQHQRSRSDS